MLFKGERFLLLCFPIVVFFAVMELGRWKPLIFLALFYVTITVFPTQSLHKYLRIYDDGWKGAGQYVQTLPRDAVILSWWSPGHLITCLGDRAVVIDGGSQHLKRIFWISRILATTDLHETQLIGLYLANFGDVEINAMVDQGKSWNQMLNFMTSQLSTKKLRPVYLLLYKEMLLNYPSILQMANWFVKQYPETKIQSLESTCYFRLLTRQFDTILPPQYTYNDGKNVIKIWRLS